MLCLSSKHTTAPVCLNAASSVPTLMSNLCSLLPFLTLPLTFLLFPLLPSLDPSFSSSYLLFVSAVGLVSMATSVWVHKHSGGVRVERKRGERAGVGGGGVVVGENPTRFQDMAAAEYICLGEPVQLSSFNYL